MMKRNHVVSACLLLHVFTSGGLAEADEKPATGKVVDQTAFRPVIPAKPATAFAVDEKTKPLKVKIFPMYSKLPRGAKCPVAVELEIKDGWHINANPSNPDFLVPTKLEVRTKQKVKLTKIKYPDHHKLRVKGSPDPYHVYDGKVLVYGLLEIDAAEKSEFAELEFHVNFQGCNEDQCLPPDKIVMKGKLKLAAEGEELKKINENKFPKPKKTTDKKPASPK